MTATALPLTRLQRAWLWGALAFMLAELSLCASLTVLHPRLTLLMPAFAVDTLLLTGGTLAWLARRHGGLGALGVTPRRVARLALLATTLVLGLLLRLALRRTLPWAWMLAPLGELTVLVLLALALRRRLDRFLPPLVRAALRLEATLWPAAWRWLCRRAPVADARFTTTRTSRYGQLVVAVLVMTLVEAPALHLALYAFHAAVWAQLLLFVVQLYGLAWVAGDYQLMRESGHRLTDEALELRLGLRWHGRVPRALIAAAPLADGARRGALTPADRPNVVLTLRAPVVLTSYLGRTRTFTTLRLYVDEPGRLLAALAGEAAR